MKRFSSRLRKLRVLLVLPVLFAAESHGDMDSTPSRPALQPPAHANIPSDYRTRWQTLSKLAVSGMHWNQWVIVYSNKGGADYHRNQNLWWQQEQSSGWTDSSAQQQENFRYYSPGTILVKEGFSGERREALEPAFLAIMVKHKPGYDPGNGDWEFIKSTPQGRVLLQGPMSSAGVSSACGGCHTNVADRDYVFATTGMGSK